jgi:hypothetical protein
MPAAGLDVRSNSRMREYLKAAFRFGIDLPGIGRLPVNPMAMAGFLILGFANPAFWLLGAGLEAGFLTLLATNPRFQRRVDAERRSQVKAAGEADRDQLVRKLDPRARQRQGALDGKCARVLQVLREAGADDFTLESSQDALSRLSWTYLKLLVASNHLEASRDGATGAGLQRQIAQLEQSLASPAVAGALRDSQSATLKILRQREQNLERCEQTLKEVASDLARIEAQVDLALENANLRGSGAVVTANLELASQILDDGLAYGDAQATVAALDQAYNAPAKTRN